MTERPKLQAWHIGRLWFFARRSNNGLWEIDGRALPWLWGALGLVPLTPGVTVKVGAWVASVVWEKRGALRHD